MYAGGNNTENISYYLYNGQCYWNMTPEKWDKNWIDASMLSIFGNGNLAGQSVSMPFYLRPVINLRSDVLFDGNGTLSNPYEVLLK